MSSIIDKLKVKPVPNKEKGVEIVIANEKKKTKDEIEKGIMDRLNKNIASKSKVKSNIDNVEDTRLEIVDKTKDKSFKVDDFMDRLKKNRVITNITEEEKRNEMEKMKTKRSKSKKIQIQEEITNNNLLSDVIQDTDKELADLSRNEDSKPDTLKIATKRKYKRRTPKINTSKSSVNEIKTVVLGDEIKKRLPKKEDMIIIRKNSYYMNNREIFINYINSLFKSYRDEILKNSSSVSCDQDESKEFTLFTHQRIVRDYLNMYSPYRGLLLYHGLGSGKTCSSIAIAEGFLYLSSIAFTEGITSPKKIIVMTPASLQENYKQQLRKCGNEIYHKNQYWEFINVRKNPEMINNLSTALQLPTSYIEQQGGAWLVDVEKPSNYSELSESDKQLLNDQIKTMIDFKYKFINYNGLRMSKLNELTSNDTINPFDNKVIIIDEAHNFVSRIVNKIEKSGEKKYLSTKLYHYLMSAENTRIVLLTGTPMINYPNELGILFNILRGYIHVWQIPIENLDNKINLNTNYLRKLLKSIKTIDYIEVNSNVLYITKNPFSFTNKYYGDSYKGVRYDDKNYNDSKEEFLQDVINILTKNKIKVLSGKIKLELTRALPDRLDEFKEIFIDNDKGNVKSEDVFKRRIIGLTSYFRSAQEQLLPDYDEDKDYYEVRINMSDYQFEKYQEVRLLERSKEKKSRRNVKRKKDDLYSDTMSNYRIFSRAYCNFVFPASPSRPMPGEEGITELNDEDMLDGIGIEDKRDNYDGNVIENLEDDQDKKEITSDNKKNLKNYAKKIQEALDALDNLKDQYLVASSDIANDNDEDVTKKTKPQVKKEDDVSKSNKSKINEETIEKASEKESNKGEEEVSDEEKEEESNKGEEEVSDEEKEEGIDEEKEEESDEEKEEGIDEEKEEESDEEEDQEILDEEEDNEQFKTLDSKGGSSPLTAKGGLEKYSPKFLYILENIMDKNGCHLLYSQFRTLEGIGIFSLVLEANGYTLFKIKKNSSQEWVLNIPEEKINKYKMFALYTGTETVEEKEIIRNIYNGELNNIPMSMLEDLKKISPNNNYGEWIKVFMITSSGAEGINLKNTRYVHITEPYWHPVRKEQVIGRARRICSHNELPEKDRNVKVFMYLMQFTNSQIENKMSTEIRNNDVSKIDIKNKRPQSSDETLYEISKRKENISKQLLKCIKETSIDCAVHYTKDSTETLECYSFGNEIDPNVFSYRPNIKQEDRDINIAEQNKVQIAWEALEYTANGKTFARRLDESGKPTNQLYDYDTYLQARENKNVTARLTAKIVEKNGKQFLDTNV